MTALEQFEKQMSETGIASQKEMADALRELATKVIDLESEIDRIEEEKDGTEAHLSCRIDDVEADHNETKSIIDDLMRTIEPILPRE